MYNLNINKSSVVPTNLIVGRVIDKPFDSIYFKIFDGQNPFNLTGCTVEFRGTTPDGKKVVSDNVPITNSIGGEIRFTFPPNFYSAKGHFQNAYFVIKKGGYIESTNDLLINVLNAVDFNVDDAPIIIDQLDDLIQAVIDDINKQLSTVKLDIKQTQNNIDTLKKDVDAYKKEFATEISKMQKQLDDLAKAINQTDIQRPQITTTEGKELVSVISGQDLFEEINKSELGLKTIKVNGGVTNSPDSNLSFVGQYHLMFKNKANKMSDITIVLYSSTGEVYHYTMRAGYSKGWKRLDGQLPKITMDDGKQFDINDKNKTMLDFAKILGAGTKKVYIHNVIGIPEQYIHGIMNISTAFDIITFEGSAVTSGNTYSFVHLSGVDKGWKRLDGQVQKITSDNGNPLYQYSGNVNLLSELKKNGRGLYTVRATSTNGQLPMDNHVFVLTVNAIEVTLNGVVNHATILAQSTTTNHVYSSSVYVDRVTPWVNLNGQATKITKDDGKVRYITRSDDMSAFDLFKEYGDGIFTVYIHTSVGQPENYIMGTLVQNKASTGTMEGVFTGTGLSSGEMYTYTFASSGVKGWRKITSVKV